MAIPQLTATRASRTAIHRGGVGLTWRLVTSQTKFGFSLPGPHSVGPAGEPFQWQFEPGVYEKLAVLLRNNHVILLA